MRKMLPWAMLFMLSLPANGCEEPGAFATKASYDNSNGYSAPRGAGERKQFERIFRSRSADAPPGGWSLKMGFC